MGALDRNGYYIIRERGRGLDIVESTDNGISMMGSDETMGCLAPFEVLAGPFTLEDMLQWCALAPKSA